MCGRNSDLVRQHLEENTTTLTSKKGVGEPTLQEALEALEDYYVHPVGIYIPLEGGATAAVTLPLCIICRCLLHEKGGGTS